MTPKHASVLTLGLCLASSSPGFAASPEFFGEAHRRQMYEQSRLHESTAILWTLAFPGLGNVYAEDYLMGAILGMVMVFGTTIVVYGLTTDQSDIVGLGAIGCGAAYLTGGITSVLTVKDFNRELRRGLKVENLSHSPGLALQLSF